MKNTTSKQYFATFAYGMDEGCIFYSTHRAGSKANKADLEKELARCYGAHFASLQIQRLDNVGRSFID